MAPPRGGTLAALVGGPVPIDREAARTDAVVMRLTPELLESLREAKRAGIPATIRFGAGQEDSVR